MEDKPGLEKALAGAHKEVMLKLQPSISKQHTDLRPRRSFIFTDCQILYK